MLIFFYDAFREPCAGNERLPFGRLEDHAAAQLAVLLPVGTIEEATDSPEEPGRRRIVGESTVP